MAREGHEREPLSSASDDRDRSWRLIFEAIGHPTLILDTEHSVLAANRAAEQLLGAERGGLCGAKCYDLFHGTDDHPAGCPLREMLRGGVAEPVDMEMEALGGTFLVSCTPVLGRDGQVEQIIHIATDITRRKQVERALKTTAAEHRLLSDHMTDVILRTDLELRLDYVSPSVERLRGYTAEQTMNQTVAELLTPSSYEAATKVLAQELRVEQVSGPTSLDPYVLELEFTCRDGSTVWTEANLSFLRDSAGRPTGIFAVARDISRRLAVDAERRRLEAQLRHSQKMEAMGRLAGGVAHDFNNLLTVMLASAGFLRQDVGADSALRADIDEILAAASRAAELTRQLLAFSRKQLISPQVLSLNDLVSGTERMLRRIVGEDVRLETTLAPTVSLVRVDRGSLEQVLLNLVVNARDAMPDGGRLTMRTENVAVDDEPASELNQVPPGRYARLTVSDTGVGMTPEVRERVFEPFFTTKQDGRGTGLGLSTVYGIVRQSGGYVAVDSEPGRGTTFGIYLPQLDPAARPSVQPPPIASVPPRGKVILLVEDEAPLRKLVCRILESHRHRVLAAESADRAFELLERHAGPIHLLITDLVLPGLSGERLAERLAQRRPEMRVLYMSGYSDEIVEQHGMLEEGIVFLSKPFGAQQLTDKLNEALAAPPATIGSADGDAGNGT